MIINERKTQTFTQHNFYSQNSIYDEYFQLLKRIRINFYLFLFYFQNLRYSRSQSDRYLAGKQKFSSFASVSFQSVPNADRNSFFFPLTMNINSTHIWSNDYDMMMIMCDFNAKCERTPSHLLIFFLLCFTRSFPFSLLMIFITTFEVRALTRVNIWTITNTHTHTRSDSLQHMMIVFVV